MLKMNQAEKENLSTTIQNAIISGVKSCHRDITFEYCADLIDHNHSLTSAAKICDSGVKSGQSDNRREFLDFLGEDFVKHPFVLAYKEKCLSVTDDVSLSPVPDKNDAETKKHKSPKAKKSSTDSDVWGSPLRCNFPSDDAAIDTTSLEFSQIRISQEMQRPKFLGMPIGTARQLISLHNLKQTERDTLVSQEDQPALLVLCGGTDLKCTSLIGSKILPTSFDTKTEKVLKTTIISLNSKCEKDLQLMLASTTTQLCQAVYQMTIPAEKEGRWGNVAVEMKWKGACHLLETPPADASATVIASVRSGSALSSMHKLFLELSFLGKIISALSNGEVEWISEESEKPAVPVAWTIKNLIDTIQEEGSLTNAYVLESRDGEDILPLLSKNIIISERSDYDFTDRLWKALLNCMSTADLVCSLRIVFQALGDGNLQPFVDRRNKTTIAHMVREAFTGRFSSPSLMGIQPFLFLAEIGAEKLRRDYIHIFMSQHLATFSSLGDLMANEGELHSRLKTLEKFHLVLEMVSLAAWSLHPSVDVLNLMARQMLAHYQHHPLEPNHVFRFAVKTSEVLPVLSSSLPVMWCVETKIPVPLCDLYESQMYCLCATKPFLYMQDGCGGNISMFENNRKEQMKNDHEKRDIQYCLVYRQENVVLL